MFSMSLTDLVQAHQRDLERGLERAAAGGRAAYVRSPGRLASLFLAIRTRHVSGRSVGVTVQSVLPEPAPILSRARGVRASEQPLAAAVGDGCGECDLAAG